MAASVMSSIRSSLPDNKPCMIEEADADEIAVAALSMMNVDLRPHVLAPFKSEATVINYTRQVIDFWSHDTKVNAGRVQVPVLMVASEYDQIASPAMSRATVQLFPSARYLQVQGATHYCLYDRPDLIAELIEMFFKDPKGLDNLDGEVKSIACEDKAC
jgi:pimeloyl-ACP methyl ester carboxylesterase